MIKVGASTEPIPFSGGITPYEYCFQNWLPGQGVTFAISRKPNVVMLSTANGYIMTNIDSNGKIHSNKLYGRYRNENMYEWNMVVSDTTLSIPDVILSSGTIYLTQLILFD